MPHTYDTRLIPCTSKKNGTHIYETSGRAVLDFHGPAPYGTRENTEWLSGEDPETFKASLAELTNTGRVRKYSEPFEQVLSRLADAVRCPSNLRTRKYSEQGDSLDLGRWYGGERLNAWESRPKTRVQSIAIWGDVGLHCGHAVTEIASMFAEMVLTAWILENAGIPTRVKGITGIVFKTGGETEKHVFIIDYKPENVPFSFDLFAPLAYPGYFREIVLKPWKELIENLPTGSGIKIDPTSKEIQNLVEENDILTSTNQTAPLATRIRANIAPYTESDIPDNLERLLVP